MGRLFHVTACSGIYFTGKKKTILPVIYFFLFFVFSILKIRSTFIYPFYETEKDEKSENVVPDLASINFSN